MNQKVIYIDGLRLDLQEPLRMGRNIRQLVRLGVRRDLIKGWLIDDLVGAGLSKAGLEYVARIAGKYLNSQFKAVLC